MARVYGWSTEKSKLIICNVFIHLLLNVLDNITGLMNMVYTSTKYALLKLQFLKPNIMVPYCFRARLQRCASREIADWKVECVQVVKIQLFLNFISLRSTVTELRFLFLDGRSVRSPLKIVSRFPDHPEIGTLHDNFVWVSSIFLANCLSPWLPSLIYILLDKCNLNALINYLLNKIFQILMVGVQLTLSETISIWEQGFELMGQLESKFLFFKFCSEFFSLESFGSYFCLHFWSIQGTNGWHMEKQVLLVRQ